MANKYLTTKVAFILLITAALLQFYIDAPVLLKFMFSLIPDALNYNIVYLVIGLLYVTAVILLNNHFSTRTSIIINSVVLAGALPYILLTIIDLAAKEVFPVTSKIYMILEPMLYLFIFIGFISYSLSGRTNMRVLLTASFGVLFITITVFHAILFMSLENQDLASHLDYIMGLGIIVSSLGLAGCSIYFLLNTEEYIVNDRRLSTGYSSVADGDQASKSAAAGSGKDRSSKNCDQCNYTLKGDEKFCPGCGASQDNQTD